MFTGLVQDKARVAAIERNGGGVRLTLKAAITPDLIAWIAGFLDDCRIVAPLTLREQVARRQARASTGHGLGAW